MGGNTHIIHRVNLEIDVPDMRLANQVKDDAIRLLKNEILPKLEKYMDTLELTDEHIQFNQLDINLENLTEKNFEKEFSRLIVQVFHEKIEQAVAPKDQIQEEEAVKYTKEQLALESFLFFLETGRLPWWSVKSGELLQEQNLSEVLNNTSSEFQVQLVSLLRENTAALDRLLNQFSLQFIFQIISAAKVQIGFAKDELTGKIIRLLRNFAERTKFNGIAISNLQQIFTKRIIMQIISQKEIFSELQLRNILDELSAKIDSLDPINQLDLKSLFDEIQEEVTLSALKNKESSDFRKIKKVTENIKEEFSKKTVRKANEEEGIFLNNAGLVLLHPFFESFFNDFDLLKEGHFKDTESQTLAVHLLHYLATKQEFAAEHELVMEKFLCGWDPDLPIAREITISQQMKDESETLLSAAIRHWSALKSTSPDGLREGFLQREGKLILNNFQNRLLLENKAQDVLLSYLPWGYSIFKLPWMGNALYVEWQ